MAKATVGAAGIEYIQGALVKPRKANGHSHGNYLIMTHRSAATTNPNCQRIYARPADAYTRTAPVGAAEQMARSKFAAVAAAVSSRQKDLSKQTQDQAAFIAQKDSPNGYKTMRSYLWALESAAYDESNG